VSTPKPGDLVPNMAVSISREDLVRYAGAADDYVRLHWDHPYMIGKGFPDVAVHGWLTFAHMSRAVTDWMLPAEWNISKYAVRYLRPTYPGALLCGGTVESCSVSEVRLALWARDGDGTPTTTASMILVRASHRVS
jgi:acyl dehydratase